MTLLHDAELSAAFDRAALGHDRPVAVNPGYHAHRRGPARRLRSPRGGAGPRLLDLGCGTGASAPGRRTAVHEYALGGRAVHRAVRTAVCKGVVLPAGRLARDADLYRQLWRGVIEFDTAPGFGDRLRRAEFAEVRALPMPDRQTGLVHSFVGRSR
ncbi:hypothetical protein P3L51_17250 [Streptomyces sp. PSRA5]|uniref:hypothetical protein n=1 Tax=Streptomyces panacea TaxID=3035064 RepID=UPI00339CD495